MSKETFFDIESTRLAASKLWSPSLSIDMLGRDWAALDGPFGFQLVSATLNASTFPTVTTIATLSIDFPTDWALDTSFDDLEVAIVIRLDTILDFAAGFPTPSNFTVKITDSTSTYESNTANVTDATNETFVFTLVLPVAALPTGQTDILIKAVAGVTGATNILTVSHPAGRPDCQVLVRYV